VQLLSDMLRDFKKRFLIEDQELIVDLFSWYSSKRFSFLTQHLIHEQINRQQASDQALELRNKCTAAERAVLKCFL
jgi:hypothetical protein